MRKGIIVIFIFMSLFSSVFSYCRAETIEFAIENSPYYVQKDLLVKKGDTLSVESGVVIDMAKGAGVIIEGRISITGYPRGGEVIFKARGPYQNYHKGFWKGIIVKSNEKNIIKYTVIQHSKIGIEIKPSAFADITDNVITQNKVGIKAERAGKLAIMRNSFLSNFTDIEFTGSSGLVDKNFFQGSRIAIKLNDAYPQINSNYFKQLYKGAIESDDKESLQLGRNWWGSADKKRIKALIIQERPGRVIFEPFLEKAPDLSEVGVDLSE